MEKHTELSQDALFEAPLTTESRMMKILRGLSSGALREDHVQRSLDEILAAQD